jgi:photosystem II stability/assembly factor-like uncharacterized protein
VSGDGGQSWSGQTVGAGSIAAISIDPQTPSRVFAGLFSASTSPGLFLSTDAGATWRPTGFLSAGAFAADPITSSTLYACPTGYPWGVYRTTDGGANWSQIDRLAGDVIACLALAVDPASPATVYAGTSKGVYKSTDAGSTWTHTGPDSTAIGTITVDPRNPSTVYAATQYGGYTNTDGIRKSIDSGKTWITINAGIKAGTMTAMLAIDPINTSTLYAAGSAGVFRSLNGGTSWTAINSGLRIETGVQALAVAPSNPSILYAAASAGGLYRSTDSGSEWSRMPIEMAIFTALAIDPANPARVYAGATINPADAFVARVGQ